MKDSKRKSYPVRRAIFGSLGKFAGLFNQERNPSNIFMLFNHAVVGGADLVHARIARSIADLRPWIYFTLSNQGNPWMDKFAACGRIFDIAPKVRGKAGKYFQIGKLAAVINRHPGATVFCGHSRFFYELVPLLRPDVRCLDIVHAMASLEHFSLPAVPRLETRVVITARMKEDLRSVYTQHGLDTGLAERIRLIENCVEIPPQAPTKDVSGPIKVLFVGRGSKEKRIHLVGRVARVCRERALDAEFTLVGDVESWVEPADREHLKLKGVVTDEARLNGLYDASHILLITSSTEGFPLVVMEAMARGVVPVCTNVGGMAAHVITDQTGVLVESDHEDFIVAKMVETLVDLAKNRARLATLAVNSRARALENFSPVRFEREWRALLVKGAV